MARTPVHSGEHLREQLKELGMSAAELARQLRVPTNRVTRILKGQRAVTGDSALRLPPQRGYFPTPPIATSADSPNSRLATCSSSLAARR
jgi:addiction module HigA family antidote